MKLQENELFTLATLVPSVPSGWGGLLFNLLSLKPLCSEYTFVEWQLVEFFVFPLQNVR